MKPFTLAAKAPAPGDKVWITCQGAGEEKPTTRELVVVEAGETLVAEGPLGAAKLQGRPGAPVVDAAGELVGSFVEARPGDDAAKRRVVIRTAAAIRRALGGDGR